MKLSVIIPVHNGGEDLGKCLEAVSRSSRLPDEIIVVDDASTDLSAQLATHYGSLVIRNPGSPLGPARSRNRGAENANSDVLVFIDADVLVHTDTLALIDKYMTEFPEISGLFGSYDDSPYHRSLVSLYKNLQHHFVHQTSKHEASTFWTGVGAIRREVFVKLGGFDESFFKPSIEDIELGVRLRKSGYQVRLFPDVQVTHLKRWNLLSLLHTDIFRRAIPWTRLILSTSQFPSDLNLDRKSKISAAIVWVLLIHLILGFWFKIAWFGTLVWLGLIVTLNYPLYHFFYEKNGLRFAVGAVFLHLLYLFYSSLTFGTVWFGFSANQVTNWHRSPR
ncbi:MAG: glycosyltransferase [Candidatus Methanosuratincola sp.]